MLELFHTCVASRGTIVFFVCPRSPPFAEFFHGLRAGASNARPKATLPPYTLCTLTLFILSIPHFLCAIATSRITIFTFTALFLPLQCYFRFLPLNAWCTLPSCICLIPLRLTELSARQAVITFATDLVALELQLALPTFPSSTTVPAPMLPLPRRKLILRLRHATITTYTTLDTIITNTCVDGVRMLLSS